MTRVVSHGHDGTFTIDLGVKAIASESTLEDRLYLLGLGESVRFLQHSEEHLVCQMLYGDLPQIGDVLYAIPHHICPTVSLYDEAFLIVDKEFSEIWPITARTRNITL